MSPLFQKTQTGTPSNRSTASQKAFLIHRQTHPEFAWNCLLQAAYSFSGKGEVRAGLAAQEPYTGLCHSVTQFHYLQNRDNGTKIVIGIIMISLQAQHQLINAAKFDTCSSQSHITLQQTDPFHSKRDCLQG